MNQFIGPGLDKKTQNSGGGGLLWQIHSGGHTRDPEQPPSHDAGEVKQAFYSKDFNQARDENDREQSELVLQ